MLLLTIVSTLASTTPTNPGRGEFINVDRGGDVGGNVGGRGVKDAIGAREEGGGWFLDDKASWEEEGWEDDWEDD